MADKEKKSVRLTLSGRDLQVIIDALQDRQECILRDITKDYDEVAIYKELARDSIDTDALFSKLVNLT